MCIRDRVEGAALELAGPRRGVGGRGRRPRHLRHHPGQFVDRELAPRPHVEQEAAAPGGTTDEGVDHVVDEEEVACLLPVAEDGDGLAALDTVGEDGDHPGLAVGILAGTVDVGQGQGAELHGVELRCV